MRYVYAQPAWFAALLVVACGKDATRADVSPVASGADAGLPPDSGQTAPEGDGEDTPGEPSEGGDAGVCAAYDVSAQRVNPDMLIVLDRSGSMLESEGPKTRWNGSVDAINTVTRAFDTQFRFGLMAFPGPEAPECGAAALLVDVAGGAADDIAMALEGLGDPQGKTPTPSALEQAQEVLDGVRPAPGQAQGPRYVLLVTDGGPTCVDGRKVTVPEAVPPSVEAIAALARDGVATYVIGYRTSEADLAENLDMMAAAGATGDLHHRAVSNGDELFAEFQEIAGEAVSCDFALEESPSDPTYVDVRIDGRPLKLDGADGWRLRDDGVTISVVGGACATLRDGQEHALAVRVQCEPVVVL